MQTFIADLYVSLNEKAMLLIHSLAFVHNNSVLLGNYYTCEISLSFVRYWLAPRDIEYNFNQNPSGSLCREKLCLGAIYQIFSPFYPLYY